MLLSEIPEEILVKIFQSVHDAEVDEDIVRMLEWGRQGMSRWPRPRGPRTIFDICCVSCNFNKVAQRVLYSVIFQLDGPRRCSRFMDKLLEDPKRLQYVRTLVADPYASPSDPPRAPGELDHEEPKDWRHHHQETIRKAISAATPNTKTQNMWLDRLMLGQTLPFASLLFQLLPNIRRLVLRDCDDEKEDAYFDPRHYIRRMIKLRKKASSSEPSSQKQEDFGPGLQKLEEFVLQAHDIKSFAPLAGAVLHLPRVSSFHLLNAWALDRESLPWDDYISTYEHIETSFPRSVGQVHTLSLEYNAIHPLVLECFLEKFERIKHLTYVERDLSDSSDRGCFESGLRDEHTYFHPQVIRRAIEHLVPTLESLTIGKSFHRAEQERRANPDAVSFASFKQLRYLDVPGWFFNGNDWRPLTEQQWTQPFPTSDEDLLERQQIVDALPESLETLKVTWCGPMHFSELLDLLRMKDENGRLPNLKTLAIGITSHDPDVEMLEIACRLNGVAFEVLDHSAHTWDHSLCRYGKSDYIYKEGKRDPHAEPPQNDPHYFEI